MLIGRLSSNNVFSLTNEIVFYLVKSLTEKSRCYREGTNFNNFPKIKKSSAINNVFFTFRILS